MDLTGMSDLLRPSIVRWSTNEVPMSQRFDYFADALSSAVVPMCVDGQPDGQSDSLFRAEMTMAEAGPATIIRQTGSAHRSYRRASEIARSDEHAFHLVINLMSSWRITHPDHVHLNAGDAVLIDSTRGHDLRIESDYDVVHLKLSDEWVRRWIPSPATVVGRRLPSDSPWARPLISFACQLSPQFVVDSPLPVRVVTDQVGALLALVANEVTCNSRRPAPSDFDCRVRIQDCIVQRCAEPALTATEVASSLGMSVWALHRSLGRFGETFGSSLMKVRTDVALRMLESAIFRQLSIAEIGRRAGFADRAQFARVLRARSGRTPSQIRLDNAIPLVD